MDYREKTIEVVSKTLNVKPEILTDDVAIGSIAEWDSVGNLNVIRNLEDELGVEIPIEDLFELNSIKALVDEINKLKNE